jgi:branched-chain amino acid transport system ATP-binding protein
VSIETVSTDDETVIDVSHMHAGYLGVACVKGINLNLRAGEIVALVGPNGAGKSTTLLAIAGVLPCMDGSVRVAGKPVRAGRAHRVARRGLSMVPEDRGLFLQLSVEENLRLRSRRRSGKSLDVLDNFPQLGPLMKRRAGLLSGGEQQMLALAGAFTSDPSVLMIDEMSLGLAPLVVAELLDLLKAVIRERHVGVLLVEQHVHSALTISDRAYVLKRGCIVFDGDAKSLAANHALLRSSYLGS